MPICGYVVVPRTGARETTAAALAAIEGCAVYPAERHELLLLVTDTADESSERALQAHLKTVPGIDCLALSYAHREEDAQ